MQTPEFPDNQTLLTVIQKDLDLPKLKFHDSNSTEIHQYLTKAIEEMLNNDLNRLINTLYRIDVPEKKVMGALSKKNPEQIARSLATFVMERELEKVNSRMKYSSKTPHRK